MGPYRCKVCHRPFTAPWGPKLCEAAHTMLGEDKQKSEPIVINFVDEEPAIHNEGGYKSGEES